MKAKTIEDVFAFAKAHKPLICYGASDHGHMVKHFLERRGRLIDAFWITDPVPEGKMRDGVPLRSVQDVKPDKKTGILLALYERHHDSIVKTLVEKGFSEDQICCIPDDMQHEMHKKVLVQRRMELLSATPVCTAEQKQQFEKRAKEILSEYPTIKCQFWAVFRIGAVALWNEKAFLRQKTKDGKFWLFYPVAHEHRPDEELRGANPYLLTKLSIDGAEVLTPENLAFWQYIYQRYDDRFEFINSYEFLGWSPETAEWNREIDVTHSWLKLTPEEVKRGERELKPLGSRGPFICIPTRDPLFLKKEKGDRIVPDFRDKFRNFPISDYALALDYLQEQGIQAVRIGTAAEGTLDHPNLVDCTSERHSDFLDVYLVSQAKFFVGGLSGILTFAMLWAKPMLILNAPMFTTRYDAMAYFNPERDIALPNKMWDESRHRYLTLREVLTYEVNSIYLEKNSPAGTFRAYERDGMNPVKNSPEEILNAIKELNGRIDHTSTYDDMDQELQSRYRDIIDHFPYGIDAPNLWRIGAKFLRENQWLLD